MRVAPLLLLSTVGFAPLGAQASTVASIQVKSSAELEMEREITIGDIAEFSGFAEDEVGELQSVRLGEAPAGGETRTFTSEGLSRVFRAHLPRLQEKRVDRIQLTIPARVVVSRKAFRLEARDVENEIRTQLGAVCPACEVDIRRLAMPVLGPKFPSSASWKLRLRPELPKGSFSAPIEIDGPGGRRTFWVSGQLSVYRTVPVAKRAIGIGERIAANDVEFQRKDVTYASDSFPSETELSGAVAARAIAAESFVGRAMLRREPALRAGDAVKIVAGGEGWQVSADGVAQSGGHVGDTVRVKIQRTQKTLSGLLREKGLIEVR